MGKEMETEQYENWVRCLDQLERKYKYDGWAVKTRQSYDCTYALTRPTVSEQERKELQELIESPIFQARQYDDEMLEELDYHWTGGNATLGMTEVFWNAYATADKENWKCMLLREHMRAKRSYFERIPEYLCWEPYVYDCSVESAEFWYYYLMTAFDGRSVKVDLPEDERSFLEDGMIVGDRKYLSGYLEKIYQPSMEWRRRFVSSGWDHKTPRSIQIRLCFGPDQDMTNKVMEDTVRQKTTGMIVEDAGCQKAASMIVGDIDLEDVVSDDEIVIRINFYFDHIEFYWSGEVLEETRISFQELLRYAGKEGDERLFILLLALTGIKEGEREAAYKEIRSRLEKLPIDAFCLDFVAECLAGGDLYETDERSIASPEADGDLYETDEWPIDSLETEGDLEESDEWQIASPEDDDIQEKENQSLVLYDLKEMRAAEGKLIAVEGMSDLEKAQRILALLEENDQLVSLGQWKTVCRRVKAVRGFLEKNAFLAKCSVVLCYGNQDSIYFNKALDIELYPEAEMVSTEYAIGKKEKNYRVGQFLQDWDDYSTVFAVGESGAVWYYENPAVGKKASADSLAEVIANRYNLKDVTAIYLNMQ